MNASCECVCVGVCACVIAIHYYDIVVLEVIASTVFVCAILQGVDLSLARVELHVYTLSEDDPGTEEMEDEQVSMSSQWMLPSAHFHGQWESLVFDEAVKERVSDSGGRGGEGGVL